MDEANGISDTTEEPVQFSKGINLRELMTSNTEFHIDLDFKRSRKDIKSDPLLNDDLFQALDEDEDESECADILKNLEKSTERALLSCPEYLSFKELAAKMTDCIPSGECKILILEEGDGPLVPVDAEVTIHYAAYWEKEKIPFDSTLTMNFGNPTKIRLGAGKILPGLEMALTMVRGPAARVHVLLEPALAWGPRGVPPRVRPETALFVISLYSVTDRNAPDRFNSLPVEEQRKYAVIITTVNSLHTEAKDLFIKKKHRKAMGNYQHSMTILNLSKPENEYEEAEIKRLRVNTYVNLAMCYYKLHKPDLVISMLENLDYVTDIDNHCKALFYYGKAYQALGKYEEALKYYKKALKLEPKNKDIGRTMADLDEYLRTSAEKEKELWQNAFRSAPAKKESVVYDVDESFENGVRAMCQDLAGRNEYSKFDLPTGLTKDEVVCIKSLIGGFQGLVLVEDGHGKRQKLSIVKKLL